MKHKIIVSFVYCLISCQLTFAQNITIDPVAPPPGMSPPPQTGETDIHSSDKGIIQKVSETDLIINSKRYLISKHMKKKKMTKISDLRKYSLSRGSIVKFDLNKKGEIIAIEKQNQLHSFCIIDRIDHNGIVCNDRYYRFSAKVKFYNSDCSSLSRSFFKIQTKVGLEFNQDRQLIGVWKIEDNIFH
jgi:hypothetical protein